MSYARIGPVGRVAPTVVGGNGGYQALVNLVFNLAAQGIVVDGTGLIPLCDNFGGSTIDTTRWATGFFGTVDSAVTVVETSGQLQITCRSAFASAAYNGLMSANAYDLTGRGAAVQVVQQAAPGNSNADTQLHVGTDNTHRFTIVAEGTTITFLWYDGSAHSLASITYSATTHAWWRIRESGGTTFWDTSADGITWTNRASIANPFAVTAMKPNLAAGTFASITTPAPAIFDNFNVLPI